MDYYSAYGNDLWGGEIDTEGVYLLDKPTYVPERTREIMRNKENTMRRYADLQREMKYGVPTPATTEMATLDRSRNYGWPSSGPMPAQAATSYYTSYPGSQASDCKHASRIERLEEKCNNMWLLLVGLIIYCVIIQTMRRGCSCSSALAMPHSTTG